MRTKSAAELYERDFVAWTRQQVAVLRRLADLGKAERNSVRSHLRAIIEHVLKLQHSRATDPRRGWMSTIGRARTDLEDRLSPSLRSDLRSSLQRIYSQARRNVAHDLALSDERDAASRIPEACPFTLQQLLDSDWYP